ncbi:ubiquitin-activating enzyme E1 family protein [Acanthocheilonema viteae]
MFSGDSAGENKKEPILPEPAKKRPRIQEREIDSLIESSKMGVNTENGMADNSDAVLDKNLYSRQIYALGESAMMHLRKASVLISGIGSVGVEVAKNLILGGIRQVTIHDTRNAKWLDLSAQYYLKESDIGRNRAEASFERLAELNDSVTCHLSVEPLSENFVKQFDLTVLTDAPLSTQLLVNDWTRKHNRHFISTDARGLFGFIFVDVGAESRINDLNGERCKESLIEHVDAETGDVTTLDNVMHGLEDGDYVTFSEVRGMTELNGIEPLKITVKKPDVFNIGKVAADFSPYVEGGRFTQVKVPSTVSHKSLKESLDEPDIVMWDFAKFENPSQLHALWQALHSFEFKHKRSPMPRNDEDVELLRTELPPGAKSDEKLLRNFSYQACGNLAPIASIVGGIAAQEAMKAVMHHMTPLKQFLYIDCIEALPGDWSPFDNNKLTANDCEMKNSQYDGQVAVFGRAYQEALLKQKYFIVGAGAIGCELLKNLAMMGVACGPDGKMKITDMDQIEISNLNRQFLFRRSDVGSKKSEVAAKAVKVFNPNIKIDALSERVGAETESIFTDDFFNDLNGVLNALDNVDARRYMDRRCIYYRLPLIDSGTMGTKGNTQVVYPHLTESYGSSVDPPEKDIPICTLKNFPNEIQHTIQWARDLFEGLFTTPAETANQFIFDERGFLQRIDQMNTAHRLHILSKVEEALISERPHNAEECIKWARMNFQEYFHNMIAQLLHMFPPDQVTEQGIKFWSGSKRCPHVLDFNPNEPEHFNFVWAASILRAQQYGITPITDKKKFLAILNEIHPPPFMPKSDVKIAVTEAEAKQEEKAINDDDVDEKLQSVMMNLAKLSKKTTKSLVPIDFEKDDDTNEHMKFITAASNLRADNYEIAPADVMKTKQIAGRIIPALATTTAAVAGLACIELYKMIGDGHRLANVPLRFFKNGFLNLALPFFGFSEPIAAPKKKCADGYFTLWDRFEIQGPKKMKELIQWIKEETGLDVTMMSCGVSLIYSFFLSNDKKKERLEQDMKDIVEEVTKKKIPDYVQSIVLEVIANNKDDEDVEIPYIKFNLR